MLPALVVWIACSSGPSAAGEGHPPTPTYRVEGRVLLPPGQGRRGTEVRVFYEDPVGGQDFRWVETDGSGGFSYASEQRPARVVVTAAGVEVVSRPLDGAATAQVGELDVRELLVSHRLTLASADPEAGGDVRAAVWAGAVPTGPQGELPSLGSAQFPELALPATVDWLLPVGAEGFTFLVERPDGDARGRSWRTGAQQRHGPYGLRELPSQLLVD